MGVRLLIDRDESRAALYDSVSGFAFGPTFESPEQAEDFLEYVAGEDGRDPRVLPSPLLEELHAAWHRAWELAQP